VTSGHEAYTASGHLSISVKGIHTHDFREAAVREGLVDIAV